MTNHNKLREHLNIAEVNVWNTLKIVRTRNEFEVKATKNSPEDTVEEYLVDVIRAARDLHGWSAKVIKKDGLLVGVKLRAPLILHINRAL